MKKVKLAIASVLAVVVIVPVVAQADVAYNIGVVSLYKSKGVDQNTGEAKDFHPARQGGVDRTHVSGFYVSNWNSTGKFGAANLEIDLMAGASTNSAKLCSLPVVCSGKLIAPD